jgi:hypothetical protein
MGRPGWRVFAVLVLRAAGVLVAVSGVARADDPGQTTTANTTTTTPLSPTPSGPMLPPESSSST